MSTFRIMGLRCLLNTIGFALFFILISVHATSAALEGVDNSGLGTLNLAVKDLEGHVRFFSNLGSRVTGYEGCEVAARYIEDLFRELGLRVFDYQFKTVVPVNHGSWITVHLPNGSLNLRAYPLWPNLVQTCSVRDLTGELVYVGFGEPKETADLDLHSKIALMEFNSRDNWIHLLKRGVRAFVFIEPLHTTRFEALRKVLAIPLHAPRLYVTRDTGLALKRLSETGVNVSVSIHMAYETVEGRNILAVIEGEVDDPVLMMAHYDSWSVVPDMARGAEDSIGISILLELARHYSKHKPYRTIYLLALSGHWQALEGSRSLVEDFFFQNKTNGLKRPYVALSFDISSNSRVLGLMSGSNHLYRDLSVAVAYLTPPSALVKMAKILWNAVERSYGGRNLEYWLEVGGICDIEGVAYGPGARSLYSMTMLDGDPFTMAFLKFIIQAATVHDVRPLWLTPFDRADLIRWENVERQLRLLNVVVDTVVNMRGLEDHFPEEWRPLGVRRDGSLIGRIERVYYRAMGFTKLIGRVVTYNMSDIKLYTPVPNALVVVESPKIVRLPYTYMYTYADESGRFEVTGLAPDGIYMLRSFVVNWTDGRIIYSPDEGRFGTGAHIQRFALGPAIGPITPVITMDEGIKGLLKPVLTSVFKSSSIVLFDVMDPGNPVFKPPYNPLIYGPSVGLAEFAGALEGEPVTPPKPIGMFAEAKLIAEDLMVLVNEFQTHTVMQHYGLQFDEDGKVLIVFAPPGSAVDVVLSAPAARGQLRLAMVHRGIQLGAPGEQKILYDTDIASLESMVEITEERRELLSAYGIRVSEAERSFESSLERYEAAVSRLKGGRHFEAYGHALRGWASIIDAYMFYMNMLRDVTSSIILLVLVLIPFAVFLEAIFLGLRGMKRMLAITAIFTFSLLLLALLHPGLHIASNPLIMVMGFTTAILAIPLLYMLFGEGLHLAKLTRLKAVGAHFIEVDKIGMLMSSISLGSSNLRKRRFRTALSLISITLVVFSLTIFTSLGTPIEVRYVDKGVAPAYQGVLLKAMDFLPMSETLIWKIESMSLGRAIVAPRVWYYPVPSTLYSHPTEDEPVMYVYSGDKVALVNAILGLSPGEGAIIDLPHLLVEGRFLEEGDVYSVLISDELAKELYGAEWRDLWKGSSLTVMGISMRVIGVFNAEHLREMADLDGLSVAPPSPHYFRFAHLIEPICRGLLIMPWRTLMDIGGHIRSIAVATEDGETAKRIAEELLLSVPVFNAYLGYRDQVYLVTRRALLALVGPAFVLIPLIISSLTILNLVLGSIYERVREIGILSSLGLAPSTVALTFLSEVVLVSLVGSVMGYLTGLGLNKVLGHMVLMPGVEMNFTSLFTALNICLATGFAALASAYPLLKAARLVTPSIERKWRIRTKPTTDRWIIPLPVAISVKEALPVALYIKEYLDSNTTPVTGKFYTDGYASVGSRSFEDGSELLYTLAEVVLPPWEAGVRQNMELQLVRKPGEKRYTVCLLLKLTSGKRELWIRANYGFVDEVRKQLLLWRSLRDSDRRVYMDRAEKLRSKLGG